MVDKQSNSKKKIKIIGYSAFTFFLVKGLLWLILGGSAVNYFFNNF